MIKHEYIKRLDVLKQIKKICVENGFSDENNRTYELSRLETQVNEAITKIEKLKKYEKFSTDCSPYSCQLVFEYDGDCLICERDYICNIGKIKPEKLFEITFPTGSYIFGDEYDREFFNEFFEELKNGANYKYVDELNKSLYYSFDNDDAYKAYDHYKKTMKKYTEKYKIRRKEREIERLKSQLANLEGE